MSDKIIRADAALKALGFAKSHDLGDATSYLGPSGEVAIVDHIDGRTVVYPNYMRCFSCDGKLSKDELESALENAKKAYEVAKMVATAIEG